MTTLLGVFRFDETVKALNTGTKGKAPQRPEGPAGRQHLRELVNPNIVQAAPKVGHTHTHSIFS